jgi:hypothetical protein
MVYVEVVVTNYCDLLAPEKFVNNYAPLSWAKKYCPSYITNDAFQKNGLYYYRFYFSDLRDLTAFALKWT